MKRAKDEVTDILSRPQEVTITRDKFGRKRHNFVMTGGKNTSID
jgi:hypothetical protein